MNTKSIVILVLVVAIVSAGVTRYCFPQVQLKTVEVEKQVQHNDIVTVVKVVKETDGSVETTSTTTDHTIKIETDNKTTTVTAKPQWLVSVGPNYDISNRIVNYDIHAQRRILGPFFLGASVITGQSVGVSVGMEF